MKKNEDAQDDDKCKYVGAHGFILLLILSYVLLIRPKAFSETTLGKSGPCKTASTLIVCKFI